MGKKGMAKFAGKDRDVTDDGDSFRFINPLEGDESPHMVANEDGLDDREKHEVRRVTHTHVDHNEVAPDIEMDAINTVIQHLEKVPFFDGMPKSARERCLALLLQLYRRS
jgi:hypothetical protein